MRVWKFEISLSGDTVIDMPVGAKVLHVAAQADEVCLWALVKLSAQHESRRFFIVGTGHPVPANATYHGTAHLPPFVWHVLEEVSR